MSRGDHCWSTFATFFSGSLDATSTLMNNSGTYGNYVPCSNPRFFLYFPGVQFLDNILHEVFIVDLYKKGSLYGALDPFMQFSTSMDSSISELAPTLISPVLARLMTTSVSWAPWPTAYFLYLAFRSDMSPLCSRSSRVTWLTWSVGTLSPLLLKTRLPPHQQGSFA